VVRGRAETRDTTRGVTGRRFVANRGRLRGTTPRTALHVTVGGRSLLSAIRASAPPIVASYSTLFMEIGVIR
jgi:hypothetical protein